jgi:hypothetical protein
MKLIVKIFPLAILLLILITSACEKEGNRIKGSGPVVSQDFDLDEISGVSLSIDAQVYILKGDSQTVRIEAQQNIINNIELLINSEDIWFIGFDRPVKDHAPIDIFITSTGMDYFSISGSGSIESNDYFADTTDVTLNISGSGNIYVNTIAHILESTISGSGQIHLEGEASEHRINISGSGSVRAFNLATLETFVRISGSGNTEVWVSDYLDVIISGSGNVYYRGNPQIDINISGSGGVFNAN